MKQSSIQSNFPEVFIFDTDEYLDERGFFLFLTLNIDWMNVGPIVISKKNSL